MVREDEFDEKREKMEEGEADEDVYSEEGRAALLESDEISKVEEGFMEGETKEGKMSKCASCGKILIEMEDVIEKEIDDKLRWFCSSKCVKAYEKKHK